jgi:uncharacterized phage protein gp47/JayE
MASPDTTQYYDLRIEDKDPQDVFDNAIADLKTKLPDWIPRETNIEVMLLEAMSLMVAENIFAINRLPDGVVEVLLRLFGIERSNGTPPLATFEFHMTNDAGYTIPAGTSLRLALPGDLEPIIFVTDTELTIAAGQTSGAVAATGDRFTTEANGVTIDTVVELLDSIIAVDYVDTASVITGGNDPEDDEAFFTRGMTRLSRLNDTLVLPRHFVSAALEQPNIKRAIAIDNWDGTVAAPGTVAGHITVAVYGPDRLNTSGEKSDLLAILEESSLSSLAVHVVDPNINQIDVTVQVQGLAGYDAGTIVANVTAALEEYLSPMTWAWGGTVRYTELVTLISNCEGVDYIITMTTPSANVTMTGNAPLASADDINVTVVEA